MKIITFMFLLASCLTGCIDLPDSSSANTVQTSTKKSTKPKKVSRERQMQQCYDNCTDTRDQCLSSGTYRPAVCYDNYDSCADIVCCAQFKDINPLCR